MPAVETEKAQMKPVGVGPFDKAAVRLTWDDQKKTWLLTAFEKKNSASDNTTDTGETAKDGERNDTATPQNTVSVGKDTKITETGKEKVEERAEVVENEGGEISESSEVAGEKSPATVSKMEKVEGETASAEAACKM